ncbi:Gustatory receptor for sugar taste 64f [Frankliniella fusca]|uniref:Gustatory receptor for sugar taste 64f n=1 Tax=Frankliniella fusca TaxID=407009 RepID=A0AAE1LIQ2_9NEOP|nr:Gustatory receptor for sugar taste 64f [Frankliniella fusca]
MSVSHISMLVGSMFSATIFVFNAMLVMVLSDALAECFRAFCDKARFTANQASDRHIPTELVENMRALYNELSRITLAMDHIVGSITLVTLLADGLYIFQVLLLFLKNPEENLVAHISNIPIAVRFFLMLYFVSSVHSEWLSAKSCLLRLLPHTGGMEVLRFFMQITTDKVSLTAAGLVSFTRPLILALLGAVLSYEIILVQFETQ